MILKKNTTQVPKVLYAQKTQDVSLLDLLFATSFIAVAWFTAQIHWAIPCALAFFALTFTIRAIRATVKVTKSILSTMDTFFLVASRYIVKFFDTCVWASGKMRAQYAQWKETRKVKTVIVKQN